MPLLEGKEFEKQQDEFSNKVNDIDSIKDPAIKHQTIVDTILFSATAAQTTTQKLNELHENGIIHRDLHTGNNSYRQ